MQKSITTEGTESTEKERGYDVQEVQKDKNYPAVYNGTPSRKGNLIDANLFTFFSIPARMG